MTLKLGKSADPDGLVSELLIHGGIAVELALTKLSNIVWDDMEWPEDWTRAVLLPLCKGAGVKLNPSNHGRMLAMPAIWHAA